MNAEYKIGSSWNRVGDFQFKAGDKLGLYRPTVELIGGNTVRFTVEAKAP